jgi:hypothetical protein
MKASLISMSSNGSIHSNKIPLITPGNNNSSNKEKIEVVSLLSDEDDIKVEDINDAIKEINEEFIMKPKAEEMAKKESKEKSVHKESQIRKEEKR